MTTLASSLLDFILSLFRDPQLRAEFDADPQRVLAEAGLGDVDPADCQALIPIVADYSPVAYGGGSGGGRYHDRDDGGHHHPKPGKDDDCDDDHHGGRPHHDWNGHGHDTAVIHNIRYVENHHSTTEIDITKIDVDIDASHSIWAAGDAYAIWGDDNVIATGGSVAAGKEVEDVSIDNSTDVDVDIEDAFNDKSTTVTGDGNAVGEGNAVDNSTDVDVDVEIDDIVIGENAANVEDSQNVAVGEDNVVGDTELEVGDITTIDDSFNGNTLAGGDVDQSTTEVEVEVEDSFNGNTLAGGDVDQSSSEVEVEESFNDNFSDNFSDNELEVKELEADIAP
jgi:hypothetical protein